MRAALSTPLTVKTWPQTRFYPDEQETAANLRHIRGSQANIRLQAKAFQVNPDSLTAEKALSEYMSTPDSPGLTLLALQLL